MAVAQYRNTYKERPYRPGARVKDHKTPLSPPVNGGKEEDSMLTTFAFAEVRGNPAGKEFIETASIAASVKQVKMRSARLHGDAPNYKTDHPRKRFVLLEIREIAEEKLET